MAQFYKKRIISTPCPPPKAVKKWLDEEYPAIQQEAKKEAAEIHWGDETGLCNGSYHGRSYAPEGKPRQSEYRIGVNEQT